MITVFYHYLDFAWSIAIANCFGEEIIQYSGHMNLIKQMIFIYQVDIQYNFWGSLTLFQQKSFYQLPGPAPSFSGRNFMKRKSHSLRPVHKIDIDAIGDGEKIALMCEVPGQQGP